MEQSEIIKSLKLLTIEGVKLKDIENEIGLPKNNLAGILNGSKIFPKKWTTRIEEYLQSYKKKKVVFVEDGNGNWETLDGRKCKLVWLDELDKITKDFLTSEKAVFKMENVGFAIPTKNVSGYPVTVTVTKKDHYVDNSEIEKQIAAVKAEKIPPERNTTLGKKIWQKEQENRINELKLQIK